MSTPTPPVVKHPDDDLLYVMDFGNQPEIVAGDTIGSCTVTATPEAASASAGAAAVTVGAVTVTSTTATVRLAGGTDGRDYDVEFKATLASARTRALVGELQVRSGPT